MALKVTPELEARLDALVATGRYPDSSAVLTAAVELLAEHEEENDWLRHELAIGAEQADRGETLELTRERFESIKARAFADAPLRKSS